MKLSKFKESIGALSNFSIQLPNGDYVPSHFHITEMGLLTKNFIDCGNTIRNESYVTFQVWFADDLDHRLSSSKVLKIIDASKNLIQNADLEIEVEYQMKDTIGKFGLEFENNQFILTPKQTTCLASDHCGIPEDKMKVNLGELKAKTECCSPNSNCC